MRIHAGPAVAMKSALSTIEVSLDRQAQLLSYIDDFRYLLCPAGISDEEDEVRRWCDGGLEPRCTIFFPHKQKQPSGLDRLKF